MELYCAPGGIQLSDTHEGAKRDVHYSQNQMLRIYMVNCQFFYSYFGNLRKTIARQKHEFGTVLISQEHNG